MSILCKEEIIIAYTYTPAACQDNSSLEGKFIENPPNRILDLKNRNKL
jgi:hypothetical protein